MNNNKFALVARYAMINTPYVGHSTHNMNKKLLTIISVLLDIVLNFVGLYFEQLNEDPIKSTLIF